MEKYLVKNKNQLDDYPLTNNQKSNDQEHDDQEYDDQEHDCKDEKENYKTNNKQVNQNDKLINKIKAFISDIVIGTERAAYRIIAMKKPELLNSLTIQGQTHNMHSQMIVMYFNRIYRGLIYSTSGNFVDASDKDPYYYKTMSEIVKLLDDKHSYVCLLLKFFHITLGIHNNIKRENLNIDDLNNFHISLSVQFDKIFDNVAPKLVEMFNHKCSGEDIKNCDPNTDLFITQIEPIVDNPVGSIVDNPVGSIVDNPVGSIVDNPVGSTNE